jgi:hypothetical protein
VDLRRWNIRHVAEALESAPRLAPFPASNTAELAALKERLGGVVIQSLLKSAEADMGAPVPALPVRLYREFADTGRREGYEDAQRARRSMLYRLTLAEWLEGEGRFLAAVEDLAWARLEETNWAWPAHAKDLDQPTRPTLDLAAAMTALDMAEMDHLLGDRLSSALRQNLRHEVERRVVGPFLERDDHWWLHSTPKKKVNNWTAVCVAGAVGAALYLENDAERLARIVTRGLGSLADYLETFDREGGSTEGPDYWTYGFGNYAVLAHLLKARSGGAIDILAGDFVRSIAQFPLRTMLAPGVWVSFSDSDSNPTFHPGLLTLLCQELDLPELLGLGMTNDFAITDFNQFCWPLRQFAWPLPEKSTHAALAPHDWYAEMGWMVSRFDPANPDALSLAAKGGHNDEMHNQNDLGSFMVVIGDKVVLTDPGRGRYSKAYFGPERYDNLMASSRGHSVPVVNGFEQAPGSDHRASVLDHEHGADHDRLDLDLTKAYPAESGLARLTRRLTLDRTAPAGRISLEDEFDFSNAPGTFSSVLVTPMTAEAGNGVVQIGTAPAGLRIDYDAATLDVAFDRHEGVEKQYRPPVDLTRLVFTPRQQSRGGRLALTISPLG